MYVFVLVSLIFFPQVRLIIYLILITKVMFLMYSLLYLSFWILSCIAFALFLSFNYLWVCDNIELYCCFYLLSLLISLFVIQALQNEERARSLENQLLLYQGDHSHTNKEVSC